MTTFTDERWKFIAGHVLPSLSAPPAEEALLLRDRIRRLRSAIRSIGVGGEGFIARYTPHYKRGEPRPDSLAVPSAKAWADEVLAGDDALAARPKSEEP